MRKLVLLVLATCLMTFSFSQHETLKPGVKMPMVDYKMEATTGDSLTLKDIKGMNGTLVIFSCNTCPFVVGMKDGGFAGWEKDYNAIADLASANGLGVVLVNSNEAKRPGEDSMEEMQKRAELMQYKIAYVLDKDSKLADAFGAKTTPHVFLFNENDELIYVGSIDNTWDPKRKEDIPYLQNAINNLKGKIKVQESEPRGCSIKRVAQ